MAGIATAAVDEYYGIDPGAGSHDLRPNSDAAAAALDAAAGALGIVNFIDFEALPPEVFGSKEIADGVTVTLVGYVTVYHRITGDPGDETLGYNTTAGGHQFLQFAPDDGGWGYVHFDFDEPIQAFGAYLTGVGSSWALWTLEFDDGETQVLHVDGDADGGVLFEGFTDAGKEISSVSLVVYDMLEGHTDVIGIDDIRYVPLGPPPPIEVDLDIKPGSYPNSINLKSKGVLPVAVLTTDDFDACNTDPATVGFGPADAAPLRWVCEDVDGDGDVDLLFHFKTQEVGLSSSDTCASLVGFTLDGDPLIGTDSVRIVPKAK